MVRPRAVVTHINRYPRVVYTYAHQWSVNYILTLRKFARKSVDTYMNNKNVECLL